MWKRLGLSKMRKKPKGKYLCMECLKQKNYISGSDVSCPKCSEKLSYIKEYNRWYCYTCLTYPRHVCPECGLNMEYQNNYNTFYCHNCKKYPSVHREYLTPNPKTTTQPMTIQHQGNACTQCNGLLTYIPEYGRLYCYRCKKYA